MKSFLPLMALPALFTGAFATPTPEFALTTRDAGTTAYSDVSALYTQIKQYTGAINTTTKSLTSHSTASQNTTAQGIIIQNIHAITLALNNTDIQIVALSNTSPKFLAARADNSTSPELQALGQLVEDLILEINGALQLVIDTLGLTQAILSSLQPLVTVLSQLILDLDAVVDGLLAFVKVLVDGLLTGLSAALDGLVL